MKSPLRHVAMSLAVVLCAVAQCYGQSAEPSRLSTSSPYRTLLVPYPTAEAADAGGLERQRYLQPIVEWQRSDADSNAESATTLRGQFTFPFSWLERQVFLRVEALGAPYEVVVNGRVVGGSANGYVAAEYNITRASVEDRNSVEIRLLSSDTVAAIECFDSEMPMPIAYVISQPRVRIREVLGRTSLGMGGVVNANFDVVVHNETLGQKSSRVYYELYLNDTIRLHGGHRDVTLGMYGVDTLRLGTPIPDSVLWSAESPTRLSLRLKSRIAGRDVEFYDVAVGLRSLEYSDGVFRLNGRDVELSWCELSPRSTIEDVAAQYAAGVRAVRFTAGVVADELLDYCDSVGIYVAVTAPINSSRSGESRRRGGNPSNDPAWREEYVRRTEQMIHTTKRHPSVIAYFLADDSANGICLYESYLAAKRIAGDRAVFYTDRNGEWNSD